METESVSYRGRTIWVPPEVAARARKLIASMGHREGAEAMSGESVQAVSESLKPGMSPNVRKFTRIEIEAARRENAERTRRHTVAVDSPNRSYRKTATRQRRFKGKR